LGERPFGRPGYHAAMTGEQQMTAAAALAVCWGVVVVFWVAGALYNVARAPARHRRRVLRSRTVLVIVVVILAVAVARLVPDSAWQLLAWNALWVTALGLAVLAASTAFTLWARAALGTMWSASATIKEGHALRTHGPYGVTRHPIYTGMLGMLLATVLLLGGGAALLIVPAGVVFLGAKIGAEEQVLTTEFPDDYARYRRDVPQLVPRLRPRRRRP
jgi:protein-S-isoprenylcysteine O-methyltransferase Ste14